MKKSMFLMAAAVVALASCSKDEATNVNNGRSIDFRAAMGTRAAETTTANLEQFFVTALDKSEANYFTDAQFDKNGSFFYSNPVYYWPGDGSTLSFYAYAPSAEVLGAAVTIDKNTKTLADFAPAAEIAEQQDFVVAAATGSKEDEAAGVALTFQHQLAQVEVQAKNTHAGYVYKVTGVRIGKVASKGTFDFADLSWALADEKANYEVGYDEARELTGDAALMMAAEGDNAMLLPQELTAWNAADDLTNEAEGAYLALKIQVSTVAGAQVYPAAAGEYDWAAVAIDTNWEAGKKYIYTLDFSEGAGRVDPEKEMPADQDADGFKPGELILNGVIKFTVEVAEWTSGNTDVEME